MISSSNLPYSYQLAPKQRKHFPKPELNSNMMLKDFLTEDSNSYPSTGFKSVSRNQNQNKNKNKNPSFIRNSINGEKLLIRTRSNRWRTMINAVKNIRFPAGNSGASFLPRSLSRRLSNKKRKKNHITPRADEETTGKTQVTVTVKIKDILRWRSFRELIEDKYPPLDFDSSPHDHCTTVTTTTGSTFSSKCSSWSDGDFTLAFLPPPWSGENESESGKKYYLPCVGKETNNEVGPKEKIICGQKVDNVLSVIDFQTDDEDGDESYSCFNQSIIHNEGTKQKLVEKMKKIEVLVEDECSFLSTKETKTRSDEEEVMKLVNLVKESCSISLRFKDQILEQLLLDFFTKELTTNRYDYQTIEVGNYRFNANKMDMIKQAETWLNGVKSSTIVHGVEQNNKGVCIKDMEKERKWSTFEEETQDMGLELEHEIFVGLLNEVLDDLHL